MSQSSIGSGTSGDDNENHAPDALPSKTMGAETGESSPPGAAAHPQDKQPLTPNSDLDSGSREAPVDGLLRQATVNPEARNPEDFPDGPNVGPSPWEKDAAQGNAKPAEGK